jgi:AcrR family transcriptional regulator
MVRTRPAKRPDAQVERESAEQRDKTPATARRRRVGRPGRLSRDTIIEAALAVLENQPVEAFTLAQVAARLDTVSMAIYNYFPSREALLGEVANCIAKQFVMPAAKRGQQWKQTLRDWLWTLRDLSERYPVMLKIAGIDGKTSAGWLRITRIVGETLHGLGFTGRELALNKWLFCLKARALIDAELTDGGFHTAISLSRLDELEPDEQEHYLMLRPLHAQISGEDAMEEGFADLVAGIERKLKNSPARRSA